MTEPVYIAKCAEHGLHGERSECYVCGGEVEQVAMVPLAEVVTREHAFRAAKDQVIF